MTAPDEHPPSDPTSLARDHLANERTFLAWLRTAVAVMALGLAIAGFANTTTVTSVVAGAILVVTGTIGVFYGTVRYRQATADLDAGRFSVARRAQSAMVTSVVLVVAVFAALGTLLAGRR